MNVLVMVCGLTEALNASFVLKQLQKTSGADLSAICLVYGRRVSMPDALRHETLQYCGLFHNWASIVDLCDLSDAIATPGGERNQYSSNIMSAIGEQRIDVIVTHSPDKLPERAILQCFPEARIILFDNGLDSHVPRTIADDPWSEVRTISRSDFDQIDQAWYLVGDLLDIPPHAKAIGKVMATEEYIAHLGAFRSVIADLYAYIPAHETYSLIIGSSFYRSKFITFEEEASLYKSLVDKVTGEGGRVIFKEHPRSFDRPLLQAQDNLIIIRDRLPIEFLATLFSIEKSYSISSTALLILKKLFDIEPTLIGQETPVYRLAHVHLLFNAIERMRPRTDIQQT
ncbi:polysialyltransferase family glycosyltransferase [Phreatobacter sp.]|uniref:polysialyltransferase family glycosyltransferase n=1 Tax=Phreatobacter sp. TaxID=1966341 RepID=UPI003F6EDDC1